MQNAHNSTATPGKRRRSASPLNSITCDAARHAANCVTADLMTEPPTTSQLMTTRSLTSVTCQFFLTSTRNVPIANKSRVSATETATINRNLKRSATVT